MILTLTHDRRPAAEDGRRTPTARGRPRSRERPRGDGTGAPGDASTERAATALARPTTVRERPNAAPVRPTTAPGWWSLAGHHGPPVSGLRVSVLGQYSLVSARGQGSSGPRRGSGGRDPTTPATERPPYLVRCAVRVRFLKVRTCDYRTSYGRS